MFTGSILLLALMMVPDDADTIRSERIDEVVITSNSARSDSDLTNVVMRNPSEKYHLVLAQQNDTLKMIQETYELSTNDSTRNLWQQLRDGLEKELNAWPNCPVLGDDHKVAKFETDGGFITVTLKNTYTPTLNVLYQTK